MLAGAVDWLDMDSLYRRSAVEKTGYVSDRNLHSYEEFDLAQAQRRPADLFHCVINSCLRRFYRG